MKKLMIISLLGAMGILSSPATAQISLNVNIGSQPLWGPVGYDHVEYYYLPDVESYYYVPKQQFVYQDRGRWIFSRTLPSRYRSYDLYSGYKVVVNSRDPYRNFDRDRRQYARYKNVRTQQVIRNSNDKRYYVVKGHPHGMPPGQAKKYPSRVERPQARDNDRNQRGNDHDRKGNGPEKRGNDKGRGH
ncbi:hypothetical protein [Pedobacter gandavensis]|uniref:hypothetical protein n=1 Tax=Pedobacter gandavensis TaxID=2679963 RepID=UPI0029317577|nr:hypothetical protein [Pedobacter gandavensis]